MKTIERYLASFIGSICLIGMFVPGCASITTPDTFNQRLAIAYSTVTAIRISTTTLLDSQRISADDGMNVLQSTNAARAGLDVARKLSDTDLKAADGKLTAIRTGLTALQKYINERDRAPNN